MKPNDRVIVLSDLGDIVQGRIDEIRDNEVFIFMFGSGSYRIKAAEHHFRYVVHGATDSSWYNTGQDTYVVQRTDTQYDEAGTKAMYEKWRNDFLTWANVRHTKDSTIYTVGNTSMTIRKDKTSDS